MHPPISDAKSQFQNCQGMDSLLSQSIHEDSTVSWQTTT